MEIFLSILAVLLVFGLIVIVHEWGHMIVAKLAGVKVPTFAVGMGPPVFKKKWKDTEYAICLFPIGGFVKVEGMEPEDPPGPHSYKSKSVWARYLIVFAGPLMNFVLAIFLFFCLTLVGFPEKDLTVFAVLQGSPAEKAGIRRFDRIVVVESRSVATLEDIHSLLANREGKKTQIGVIREGKDLTIEVIPGTLESMRNRTQPKGWWQNLFRKFNPGYGDVSQARVGIGVTLNPTYRMTNVISQVIPASPAKEAKLQVGDRILAIEENQVSEGLQAMLHVSQLSFENIETQGGSDKEPAERSRPLKFKIERQGKIMDLNVSPKYTPIAQDYTIGVTFRSQIKRLPLLQSLARAAEELDRMMRSLFKGLEYIFTRAGTREVMGPVGITSLIAQSARAGPYELITLAILITLNLALLNLFPLPALDGGRLVFLFFEGVLRFKVSEKMEAMVHTLGFVLLIGLIILITFKDLKNIFF